MVRGVQPGMRGRQPWLALGALNRSEMNARFLNPFVEAAFEVLKDETGLSATIWRWTSSPTSRTT